jgi:tripartite-type tricarboxylate transporter receptor subunit TctC
MAVNKALTVQKVRDALGSLGYEPAGGSPQALGNHIASQVAYWSKVITDAGIKMPQ